MATQSEDLSGKVVVITGSNSGIGKESAVALAAMGATVVMTARDQGKGDAALAEVRALTGAKRPLFKLAGPVARAFLTRRSAYYRWPGKYADPWTAIRARLGDPAPD